MQCTEKGYKLQKNSTLSDFLHAAWDAIATQTLENKNILWHVHTAPQITRIPTKFIKANAKIATFQMRPKTVGGSSVCGCGDCHQTSCEILGLVACCGGNDYKLLGLPVWGLACCCGDNLQDVRACLLWGSVWGLVDCCGDNGYKMWGRTR